MVTFLIFILSYYCLCLLFFGVVQRPMFCIYNRKSNTEPLRGTDIIQVYSYGFRTDRIAAAYLTAIPMLICAVHAIVPLFSLPVVLGIYNAIIALALGLIVSSDTLLYRFWQFKLDASALAYLKSIRGAMASVSTWYVIGALAVVLVIGGIFFLGTLAVTGIYTHLGTFIANGWIMKCVTALSAIIIAGLLFAIVRGLGRRPNSPSKSYFGTNIYLNHCAVNPVYNFIYSFSMMDDFRKQFREFTEEKCDKIYAPLFPLTGKPTVELLNTPRPNILFIVWESLCARFIEPLGGQSNVLVNFERLAKEGVFFPHCDAGNTRTPQGLICLLSGYLGQPTTTLMRYTRKLPTLPALPRTLKKEGYHTTALHGGDLSIFHKWDYYVAAGHDRLVQECDFPADSIKGKWGIHDGVLFDWLFDDIMDKTRRGERWYTTFQTLSSHEEFKVPYNRLPDDEIANSYAYVDDAFGRFIDRLKATPAWDNLLIVCTGDHGCYYGEQLPREKYPHIPVLLLGGAVKKPMEIDTIMSQTDIAATLLGQMGLPHEDFIFSRDILADTYTMPFSIHTYNNGFIVRDPRGFTNYDNVSQTPIAGADPRREEIGKAILQKLYDDLSKR